MEKNIQNLTQTKAGNMPEKKIKAGAITATIWQNSIERKDGETASYNSVSLERVYKDKEGNWKTAS